jgi:hypothetical protein
VQPNSHTAFKEWAVVCEALREGRQTIVLRKGGIHEGRDGFRVEHCEFWLLPTGFHQQPQAVTSEARPLLETADAKQPPHGKFHVDLYAVVERAHEVKDLEQVHRLRGMHVWSDETVSQRFHYRAPGLFVLVVRVYRVPSAFELADSPYIAGCRSWVDLPDELPTSGASAVLSDYEFAQRIDLVESALAS